jgi:hypothetical protein
MRPLCNRGAFIVRGPLSHHVWFVSHADTTWSYVVVRRTITTHSSSSSSSIPPSSPSPSSLSSWSRRLCDGIIARLARANSACWRVPGPVLDPATGASSSTRYQPTLTNKIRRRLTIVNLRLTTVPTDVFPLVLEGLPYDLCRGPICIVRLQEPAVTAAHLEFRVVSYISYSTAL